jgi:Lipocalin-like domain
MKRRSFLNLSAIAALTLAMAGSAAAQQKTLKEQLVGSWTLVSTEATYPTGLKRQNYGANPIGILIFDAGGRYAMMQSRPDRPKFKTTGNVRFDTPAAEFGEAAREFLANFGTWSVNEGDKTLIRRYESALIPNLERQETKAAVSLAGDELKLFVTNAAGVRTDEAYRRAK